MSKVTFTVILLLLAAGAVGGYWYIAVKKPALTAAEPAPSPSPQPTELPQFTLTAVQADEDGRRLITCAQSRCRSLEQQRQESEAVTDGEYWYFYQNSEKTTRLVRQHIATGETKTIVEQTPLTSPRGLVISPDNQKIIYWLDNIHEPKKQLTELWVYDAAAAGTQLLAEKIYRPAILTLPRFNRSNTLVWFIGDTSQADEQPQHELLVASIKPPGIAGRHLELDWQRLQQVAGRGAMDVSPDGNAIAFADRQLNRSRLNIYSEAGQSNSALAQGDIVYMHWKDNTALFYIIQEAQYFSFWQTDGKLHRQLSRHPGTIESIRGPADGSHFVFAVREGDRTRAVALDTEKRRLIPQGPLPAFGGRTYIVHVERRVSESSVAGITSELDDAQLAAFVDKHIHEITQDSSARAQRLVLTGQPNTLLLDFIDGQQQWHRLLVTIRDAIHAEWSIRARYRSQGAEWIREAGSSQEAPKPLRLYEWEADPGQWILKENYENQE